MCTMEEDVMVTKEGDKPNRRVSDRIKRLSANFINSRQGHPGDQGILFPTESGGINTPA